MKIHVPRRRRVRIEMIPLMDMLFLLLVFFMYAMLSMTVHRGLPVHLPASEAAEAAKDKDMPLSVTVRADGSVFLDRAAVPLAGLTSALKARTGGEHAPGVLLFADRDVRYQHLFEVLDRIRDAGLSSVSLQAEPGPAP
jgi:biopolymer transport protein ExbD